MPNVKEIKIPHSTTGLTVQVRIKREADGYLLNDADGAFASAPADSLIDTTEHGTLKGLYELSESRTAWNNGKYTFTAYVSTDLNVAIAIGQIEIIDDLEVVHSVAESAGVADAVWDEILTGATHNIATSAGKRVRQSQENLGYELGAIWIDTVNGTSGTEDFVNGTVGSPVNNVADLNTLSASLNINRFQVAPASSITFAAAQNGQVWSGENWTLALGGQEIIGSKIIGAVVSGSASGVGTTQVFERCILNTTSHIKGTHVLESGVAGTQTALEAGNYFFDRCHSAIAGLDLWTFDFGGAIGNTQLNIRNYSGGIQLESMGDTGTDTASIEGQGQIIEGTCTGGVVAVRGLFTVSGITNLTLSDDARIDITQVAGSVWKQLLSDSLVSGSFGEAVNSLLGLCLENHVEDDIIRDPSGNKTSATLYFYNSAANATAHDKSTGLISKVDITATYSANKMTLLKGLKA